jgi:hypothetical protein
MSPYGLCIAATAEGPPRQHRELLCSMPTILLFWLGASKNPERSLSTVPPTGSARFNPHKSAEGGLLQQAVSAMLRRRAVLRHALDFRAPAHCRYSPICCRQLLSTLAANPRSWWAELASQRRRVVASMHTVPDKPVLCPVTRASPSAIPKRWATRR